MSAPELPDFSLSFRRPGRASQAVEHTARAIERGGPPSVAEVPPLDGPEVAEALRGPEAGRYGGPRALSLATPAAVHAWHAFAHARLCAALAPAFGPFSGEGGWWLGVHPELKLGADEPVRPDLAGWRRDHLPGLPDGAFRSAPDWVAEILSPGATARDRIERRRVYAEHEVPFLWLVDPSERVLEAFAWDDGRWALLGAWTDGEHLGVLPFDNVVLDVGSLFPPR